MRLCTFEVATHLGRHLRVGACKDGRVIDLNFAEAWYMAQQGEGEPQRLADGLVPSSMEAFVRSGLRALHSAEELFLGSGPHPADWWLSDPPPRGPNDETLVYQPQEVRLRAPLPCPWLGPGDELPSSGPCEVGLAAVIGPGRNDLPVKGPLSRVTGFTLMASAAGRAAIGPVLLSLDDAQDPSQLQLAARVNGQDCGSRGLGSDWLERVDGPVGQVVALPVHTLDLAPGDSLELECEPIGVLAVSFTSRR